MTGFDGSQPVQAALLPGGRSNITYRVTDASGHDARLRRPPLGHLLPSAHDMGREFRVMHGLGQVGFPVPPTHALCTDHDVIGSDFVVMGFVDGRVIATGEDSATLTPDERSTASRLLIDGLAALHRVDVEAAGLTALGRPSGYLQRQVEALERPVAAHRRRRTSRASTPSATGWSRSSTRSPRTPRPASSTATTASTT